MVDLYVFIKHRVTFTCPKFHAQMLYSPEILPEYAVLTALQENAVYMIYIYTMRLKFVMT